jgi:HAD superfamily hydrolase (TIGR01509 family)
MTPRAVVLDVDGTLIDSNAAHARAWVEALARVGVDVPFERVLRMIGMGGDKLLPKAVGLDPESGPGSEASKLRGEIFKSRYLDTVRPFPHARDLLERFRAAGIRLTVASSAKPDELDAMLERIGVRELIETATSGGQQPSKPDPDTVAGVLERAGVAPDQALMLGDTPYDVEAAGRAGVQIVALRCGGWDRPELDGAIAIYDDPADLLAHFDESPFAGAEPGRREPPVTAGQRDEEAHAERQAEAKAKRAR